MMEDVGKNLNRLLDQKNYRTRFEEMMQEVLQDADVRNFLDLHKNRLTRKILSVVMQNFMSLSKKNVNLS